MERQVTPPKLVTSPTWGPLPPCNQALKQAFCRTSVTWCKTSMLVCEKRILDMQGNKDFTSLEMITSFNFLDPSFLWRFVPRD